MCPLESLKFEKTYMIKIQEIGKRKNKQCDFNTWKRVI